MSSWPPIQRLRREWDARFLKAIARLEFDQHRRERCGGCGQKFAEHRAEDFAECVRRVLSTS